MKFTIQKFALTSIVLMSLALRLINVEGRAPFGWDQERDYRAVEQIVVQGNPTLIGPVVRGEGGFMLGPLYYYLLSPMFFLLGGDPLSLPLTSAFVDVITVVLFYLVASSLYSKKTGLISALLWGSSWFSISSALTSWNVILITPWILGLIFVFDKYTRSEADSGKYLSALLALFGLSFHVHAILIPIIPILLAVNWSKLRQFHISVIIKSFLIFLLFVSPLVLFDLRHDLLNANLFIKFITTPSLRTGFSSPTHPFDIFNKLLILLSSFAINYHIPIVGFIIFMSPYFLRSKAGIFMKMMYTSSSAYIIFAILFLNDRQFPEYYLLPLLAPAIISLANLLSDIHRFNKVLFATIIMTIVLAQAQGVDFETGPFSLKAQKHVADRIKQFSDLVDLRIHGSPTIGVGINTSLAWSGITISEDSPHKIVLTDSTGDTGTVSEAEKLFEEQILGYKLAGFIVK